MSHSAWPVREELREKFPAIDKMVERIDQFKADPGFSQEVGRRDDWIPKFDWPDEDILHRMIDLIAYGNAANSKKVGALLESGVFNQIFQGYSVESTAALSAEALRDVWMCPGRR